MNCFICICFSVVGSGESPFLCNFFTLEEKKKGLWASKPRCEIPLANWAEKDFSGTMHML